MKQTIDLIKQLAGAQRADTFAKAAEFILTATGDGGIVETGCYRGIPQDGQSTLILALLAGITKREFHAYDISAHSVQRAKTLIELHQGEQKPSEVVFHLGDSLEHLHDGPGEIKFAYLDSLDHDPNNPGPCQRHELAEIGAIYHRLADSCAILLDDCVPKTGGKTALGAAFLKDKGWKLVCEGYQLLFVRP